MSSRSPISGSSSPAGSETDSIAPGGSGSSSAPRRWVSPMQSSNDITPDRQAAVFSPSEWPISATGFTPQDIQSCASACSTIMISGSWAEGCCSFSAASASCPGSGSQSVRMS